MKIILYWIVSINYFIISDINLQLLKIQIISIKVN